MNKKLEIKKGEIHLWITIPEQITDPLLLKRYRELLTEEEKNRVNRYRFEKDQHSSLVTRAFIRSTLSHYSDMAPQEWRFSKGEKDKPEIINPPLPLRFNLSHTEGMVICAITLENDIGCDVEYIGRDNDVLAIADRYFSPQETRELFSLPENAQRDRFFDYWTLKESYIKAWGLGLAIPLDDFSFTILSSEDPFINNHIRLSFAPHRIDYPELWHSWLLYPNDKHRMAISIQSEAQASHSLHFYHSTPLVSYSPTNLPFKYS